MAISLKSANILIQKIQPKLKDNYKIEISIDGLQEMVNELENVLDVDYDSLRQLNKESLLWYQYITDLSSILLVYQDRFKNTLDVYSYLSFLSKKDKNNFMLMAPKYKIPTRNIEDAVVLLANKKSEMEIFVKDLNTLMKFLESYRRYMIFHYFRTSRLINHSYARYKNTEDI